MRRANVAPDSDDESVSPAPCIRKVANFTYLKQSMLLDQKSFTPAMLKQYIPRASPKLQALFDKIAELDALDLQHYKKQFKHMIFTDAQSSNYGVKIIASAFIANGYVPAFASPSSLHPDEILLETKGRNFGMLLSRPYAKKTMSTKFKKSQMLKYNERPANNHGDLMRFILLDQGFKEGIDLFDVKYVHLFEPLVSLADQKQAIGRGTRFCGQKGLAFHPRYGWPLYVFKYDVALPHPINGAKTFFELFMNYSYIDIRRINFAADLETAAINAAVDKHLTANLHTYRVDRPTHAHDHAVLGQEGGARSRAAQSQSSSSSALPPKTILALAPMHKYISTQFAKFAYPPVKLENLCAEPSSPQTAKKGKKATSSQPQPPAPITFTPTQDFVRHYFQPASAYKGLLLFHSVGVGKTCTAIATATSSFEREGYTILWVTRHTLKADIWKNMFDQVCHTLLQEQMDMGEIEVPKKRPVSGPMRYLSDQWIEPISYKQFSNLLLKKNNYYDEIVERNGTTDPLRKTLIVIDEAHKLYAPNVFGSEKPNTQILETMIQNSYAKSGKDSCRVLLMTATPFTEDATEMLQLLNLLRPKADALPTDFDEFSDAYLSSDGTFTKAGLAKFQNAISGYISYVNRSRDARNFAHPILEDVHVPMSRIVKEKPEKPHHTKVKKLIATMKDLRNKVREEKAALKPKLAQMKAECKTAQKEKYEACIEAVKKTYAQIVDSAKATKEAAVEECKSTPRDERKTCREHAMSNYKATMEHAKDRKAKETEACKEAKQTCNMDRTQLTNAEAKLAELKTQMATHTAEKGTLQQTLTDFRQKNKSARIELKTLRSALTKLREDRKKIYRITVAKGLRKAQGSIVKYKAKDALLLKELADMTAKINDLRDQIVSVQTSMKLGRIEMGQSVLGNISQEKALRSKCHIPL